MSAKFDEAVRILCANLALLGAIILTIWLPGNLLTNYLTFEVFGEDDLAKTIRVTLWIERIFGPIYIGAMIYALAQLKQGQRPTYSEAMTVGFRNWGRLFVARFVAGLLIGFGIIALIVPGIVLAVRYALLDPAVILEDANVSESRKRSTQLTEGIRWQIFFAALLFHVAFGVIVIVVATPLAFLPELDTMAANVALDCFFDILYSVIQIVMFLYYWEATEHELLESRAEETSQPHDPQELPETREEDSAGFG